MTDDRRAGTGAGHLPASEADSELLRHERGEGREDVSAPASEEKTKVPPEGDLDDGRPGKGGPGTIPPPD